MSSRNALIGLHCFLPTLFQTRYASLALDILVNLLHLRHSTYNLVKCELVDLIASCDFKSVVYIEQLLPSDAARILSLKQKLDKTDYVDQDDEEQSILFNFIDNSSKILRRKAASASVSTATAPSTVLESYKQQQSSHNGAFVVKRTQERIMEDVFVYLLGSEDAKVRMETARSFARCILNMNFYENCTQSNQNCLLANSEYALKQAGQKLNLFSANTIDNNNNNDAFNLSHALHQVHQFQTLTQQMSRKSAQHVQQMISPLSACSLFSSMPWLTATKHIVNNTFIQPFHSLIKHWPSNASWHNSISHSFNPIVEQNLNQVVPLLIRTLINSSTSDKFLFVGCLETLDLIFQVYSPAIYYSSSTTSSTNNSYSQSTSSHTSFTCDLNQCYNQLSDLLSLLISYIRLPSVAFDLYVQDIVLRLIGTLYCSYAWLVMRKLDKNVQHLTYNLSKCKGNESECQLMLDMLSGSTKPIVYQQCQAEQITGRSYVYALSFNNLTLKTSVDHLFAHCMKMLCILACVIDDSALPSVLTANLSAGSTAVSPLSPPPTAPPPIAPSVASVATMPSADVIAMAATTTTAAAASSSSGVSSRAESPTQTPSSSSKRSSLTSGSTSSLSFKLSSFRSSNNNNSSSIDSSKISSSPAAAAAANSSSSSSSSQTTTTKPASSTTTTSNYLGFFQNSSVYLKLYETTRSAYGSYKKSMMLGQYDKFTQIVKATLRLFAELLEASLSVHEIGPHIDEILLYLRITFAIDASASTKCVTLCLKSLSGLNLGGLMHDYLQPQIATCSQDVSSSAHT